jgi:23S rRNA (guanosine2251-2'-O)-methyltransferase
MGYKVICAGIRNSVSIYEADMKKPVFLIIGGEKRGISASLLEKADSIVRIDYASGFKGSLSAASSAAIIGFEVMHQNKN